MISAHESFLIARSIVRVLQDSTRIDDIHLVADITSRDRFRELLAAERAAGRAQAIDLGPPGLASDDVDLDALRALGADTLGGAYVRHLDRHNLKRYVAATSDRFIADPEVRALIRRYRQSHDVWHALLGLGVAGHEEVLVHAFTFGQLRLPISVLVILLGGIKHFALEGRGSALGRGVLALYRSGRDAAPLLCAPWEALWALPLDEVRRRYNIRPAPADLRA